MVKKSLFIFFFLFLPLGTSNASTKPAWISGSLTFATGYLTSQERSTIFLHGFFQYFVSERISIRADGFAYLGTLSDIKDVSHNHQGLLGLFYHIPLGSFVPYIGIQPGFGIFSYLDALGETPVGISPLVSATTGLAYMGSRYFMIFAEAKYIYGEGSSVGHSSQSLSEIRASFGLGFYL